MLRLCVCVCSLAASVFCACRTERHVERLSLSRSISFSLYFYCWWSSSAAVKWQHTNNIRKLCVNIVQRAHLECTQNALCVMCTKTRRPTTTTPRFGFCRHAMKMVFCVCVGRGVYIIDGYANCETRACDKTTEDMRTTCDDIQIQFRTFPMWWCFFCGFWHCGQ